MGARRVNGRWIVDFWWLHPDGRRQRIREVSPVNTRRGAEEHERQLRQALQDRQRVEERVEIPTLRDFASRWLEAARGDRQKPSTLRAKEVILERHLLPALGTKRLDAIRADDVAALKARLAARGLAPKTTNNILVVLSGMLRTAVKWRLLPAMPVEVELVRAPPPEMHYYDEAEFERLVEGAAKAGAQPLAVILLGGEAGLRAGEIMGLEWADIDFRAGVLSVRRTIWKGQAVAPKGGRGRKVPMTARLAEALRALRHLQGPRVFYRQIRGEGGPLTQESTVTLVKRAQRRAEMEVTGEIHILRHTFCSRLAMRGAPAKAIQELAGHVSLATTQRYMHLSPAWREGSIRLLEGGSGWALFGQMPVGASASAGND
jgi:integrase